MVPEDVLWYYLISATRIASMSGIDLILFFPLYYSKKLEHFLPPSQSKNSWIQDVITQGQQFLAGKKYFWTALLWAFVLVTPGLVHTERKWPYVRKNLQRIWVTGQRFFVYFSGHIQHLVIWLEVVTFCSCLKPRDRNCWSRLLFILFGYSQRRNCDWLLCSLMEKVGWIILVAWMCLFILSPEKLIAVSLV